MSEGYYPKRIKLSLADLWRGLVNASHILHYHSIADAYGHISVRNPDNAAAFYMPRNVAPALVSSLDDIVEYKVEDASPVEENAPEGYVERFIHSEIYKRFPNVNCVIHSHAGDVQPYCVNGVPLKPTIHTAGFLGASVPVWDITSTSYSSGNQQQHQHDLLVRTSSAGHSLAATFKPSTSSSFIYSKMRSALPSQIAGHAPEPSNDPEHWVVLMRGHGFTTCAASVEEAVSQAVYTCQAARVQTAALTTRLAWFGGTIEGKVHVEAGGKIQNAKLKVEGEVTALSEKEAKDAWKANGEMVRAPWELWCREVEVCPLYRNEIKSEE